MKIKKITTLICGAVMISALISCGGSGEKKGLADGASGDLEAYESGEVNAVVQALPQIMILPSDQVLKNFGCLKNQTVNGRTYQIRDYQKYLMADDRAKRIFSTIQTAFNNEGFPLNDLEQTLKQLNTQEATDMADGFEKDAKTLLLTTAQPDIILEMNYNTTANTSNGANVLRTKKKEVEISEKNISYTLNAIDAYTNKVISSITASNIKGESTTETIQADLQQKFKGLMKDVQNYFSDILTRGRDITVRIAVAKGSNVKLSDTNIEGDTYADYIMDYIKSHTVKGAYKMQRNTDNELYFVNCRIRLLNEDGTQYGVYDWARDLAKSLRKNLGVKVTNKSQGLGEVLISIEGM